MGDQEAVIPKVSSGSVKLTYQALDEYVAEGEADDQEEENPSLVLSHRVYVVRGLNLVARLIVRQTGQQR